MGFRSVFSKIGGGIATVAEKAPSAFEIAFPYVATGLQVGGLPGASALTKIASALNIPKEQINPASIEGIIADAQIKDPTTLATMQKVEADLKTEMEQLGITREQIAATDRDSARNLAIKTGTRTPATLAYIDLFVFFAMIAGLFVMAWKGVIIPEAIKVLLIVLIQQQASSVYAERQYYFGSSSGSKDHADTIANALDNATKPGK
jgi:hypothetical protein